MENDYVEFWQERAESEGTNLDLYLQWLEEKPDNPNLRSLVNLASNQLLNSLDNVDYWKGKENRGKGGN